MKKKIVIAHGHSSIEVFHSMIPMILAKYEMPEWKWDFVDYKISNIFQLRGDLLILIRKYHDGITSDSDIALELSKLRLNFSKIVYFDDAAAASVVRFAIFPHVDEYWRRSHLTDTNLYQKEFYGGHLYSNYYHDKFGIEDFDQAFINPVVDDKNNFKKLKLAWNIGIGVYPTNTRSILNRHYLMTRRFISSMTIIPSIKPIHMLVLNYINSMKQELVKEVNLKNRLRKISSRFLSTSYRNSVGFQRELLIKKTLEEDLFLSGNISKKEFTKESFRIFGMLSPYGWGEICYRDFEAAIAGSFLIKPDMSHISTWPNIYEQDMYHSILWDLSDIDKLDCIFDQIEVCEQSVYKTRRRYLDSLNLFTKRCITMIDHLV